MSGPDSLVIRLRRRLAEFIEPGPDAGEAWCIGCALNGGRSAVLPADGVDKHVAVHREQLPDDVLRIQASWPCQKGLRLLRSLNTVA